MRRIFFARISAENLVQSTTLRPVFHLVRTKNLRQSDGLHFISVSLRICSSKILRQHKSIRNGQQISPIYFSKEAMSYRIISCGSPICILPSTVCILSMTTTGMSSCSTARLMKLRYSCRETVSPANLQTT